MKAKIVRATVFQYGGNPDRSLLVLLGRHVGLNLFIRATVQFILILNLYATTPYARFDRCLRGSRANRKSSENFFACFG